jgi:hypothetical protein
MPVLRNQRHERFVQELAKGKSASEAYRNAGYSADDGNAIRLTGNDKVKARLTELLEKGAERTLVTIESITAELEEARLLAMKESTANPSAAVSASLGKAKLHGLLIDKSESTNTHHVISSDLPTADEWADKHVTDT